MVDSKHEVKKGQDKSETSFVVRPLMRTYQNDTETNAKELPVAKSGTV